MSRMGGGIVTRNPDVLLKLRRCIALPRVSLMRAHGLIAILDAGAFLCLRCRCVRDCNSFDHQHTMLVRLSVTYKIPIDNHRCSTQRFGPRGFIPNASEPICSCLIPLRSHSGCNLSHLTNSGRCDCAVATVISPLEQYELISIREVCFQPHRFLNGLGDHACADDRSSVGVVDSSAD